MEFVLVGLGFGVMFILWNILTGKRHTDEEFLEEAAVEPVPTIEETILFDAAQQMLAISTVVIEDVVSYYVIDKKTERRLFLIDKHTYQLTPVVRLARKA